LRPELFPVIPSLQCPQIVNEKLRNRSCGKAREATQVTDPARFAIILW